MPDIGLLQGGPRPRIPAPTKLPDDMPATPARVSAAPFLAPVDVAISVAAIAVPDVSAPAAPVPAVSVPAVSMPALAMPAIVSPPASAATQVGGAAPREAPASVPRVPPMT